MIVDLAVYRDGLRQEGAPELDAAFEACQRDGAFVWLGMRDPTRSEFDSVRREFALHELAVEDAVKAHQRPKLELYGDTLFVVLKTVRYVDPDEVIQTGEVNLFVNPAFVISVRHGEGGDLTGVRRELEARPDLLRHGAGAVLHAIVDRVVDGYAPVVEEVENDVEEVEQEVFAPGRSNPAERIYKLEREVLDFHRAVSPLAAPLDRLARGQIELVPEDLRHYFRDIHDHVLRVDARVEGLRELLTSALQANLAQVTVRQNEDVRKISAWVAILAVPTMIAGIYGMNFEHMPELKWKLGYPAVMTLILVICVGLYVKFRRAGWL